MVAADSTSADQAKLEQMLVDLRLLQEHQQLLQSMTLKTRTAADQEVRSPSHVSDAPQQATAAAACCDRLKCGVSVSDHHEHSHDDKTEPVRAAASALQPAPPVTVTPITSEAIKAFAEGSADVFGTACVISGTRLAPLLQQARLDAQSDAATSSTLLLRHDWKLLVEQHHASFCAQPDGTYRLVLSSALDSEPQYRVAAERSFVLPQTHARALRAHYESFCAQNAKTAT